MAANRVSPGWKMVPRRSLDAAEAPNPQDALQPRRNSERFVPAIGRRCALEADEGRAKEGIAHHRVLLETSNRRGVINVALA